MNEWWQAVVLALIQGISEFLPVSSSAHLILPGLLLEWPDQGLAFDIAVHFGTLMAVVLYFRRDLWRMTAGLLGLAASRALDAFEIWKLAFATVPAVVAGLLFADAIEQHLRGLTVIATTTLVFGLLLAWVSRPGLQPSASAATAEFVSWRDAFLIGLAQTLALIPGTSRSGITITAALLLGYHPDTAARFSFLLSVPVIAGAMLLMLTGSDVFAASGLSFGPTLLAAGIAFVSAWSTIAVFLKMLAVVGLLPFAIYRVVLGILLFLVIAWS